MAGVRQPTRSIGAGGGADDGKFAQFREGDAAKKMDAAGRSYGVGGFATMPPGVGYDA